MVQSCAATQYHNTDDVDVDTMFTTDAASSCVHVTPWEYLGESWPYFRPNFVNMEHAQQQHGADEVWGVFGGVFCDGFGGVFMLVFGIIMIFFTPSHPLSLTHTHSHIHSNTHRSLDLYQQGGCMK